MDRLLCIIVPIVAVAALAWFAHIWVDESGQRRLHGGRAAVVGTLVFFGSAFICLEVVIF